MKLSKTRGGDGRPVYRLPENESYLVPGDIHFPYHSERLVEQFTLNTGARVLILQGDTGDQDAFSKFTKDPEKIAKAGSMRSERNYWTKWLSKWKEEFDHIIIAPGNHETRAYRSTSSSAAYIGMGWWWPYGGMFDDPKISILDMGYRIKIGNVHVEHGDLLKAAEGKFPALGVAAAYSDGSSIVFGHSHKRQVAGFTSYVGGKKKITTAYNVGTLVDVKNVNYTNQPNWQPGAAIITNGRTVEML